jgi:hypothetical protein
VLLLVADFLFGVYSMIRTRKCDLITDRDIAGLPAVGKFESGTNRENVDLLFNHTGHTSLLSNLVGENNPALLSRWLFKSGHGSFASMLATVGG